MAQHPVKNSKAGYLMALVILVLGATGMFLFMNNDEAPLPIIHQFTAEPQTISAGTLTTLSWHTENASKVELQGIGPLAFSGSKAIRPTETSIYTLIVTDSQGLSIQREIEVVITPAITDNRNEKVTQILALATQAIKTHKFNQAELLLEKVRQIAPDNPGLNQTQEYFRQTKKLFDQSLVIEEKLKHLQQVKEKSTVEETVKTKDQLAEKYRQELEEKRRQEAYQRQQQELERIKIEEELVAKQREEELAEVQRLQAEQDEKMRADEERLEKREKIKNFLDSIHR